MPKEGCKDCLLVKRGYLFDICPFLKQKVNGNVERGGKPYDCPLIELQDHGDLVDRDEQIERSRKLNLNTSYVISLLLNTATVVVPAERSEDDNV